LFQSDGRFFDQMYQSRYRESGRARVLEPRVLVGGVVHHQVHQHLDPALLRLVHELDEVAAGAVRAGRRRSSRETS
jgi:hypothetical protein